MIPRRGTGVSLGGTSSGGVYWWYSWASAGLGTTTAVRYVNPLEASNGSVAAAELETQLIIPEAGTLSDFDVRFLGVSAGTQATFTIRVDGVATGLQVVIASGAFQGADADELEVAANAKLSLSSLTAASTSAAVALRARAKFTPAAA